MQIFDYVKSMMVVISSTSFGRPLHIYLFIHLFFSLFLFLMDFDKSLFNFIFKYKSKGKYGWEFIGFLVNFRYLDMPCDVMCIQKQMKLLKRKYFTLQNIRGIHILWHAYVL